MSTLPTLPYREFLARKVHFDHACGVPCTAEQVLRRFPQLKPHQAAVVAWAITGGRRGIFANFGLGKTYMQLVIATMLRELLPGGIEHPENGALIVLPLGVRDEFHIDGRALDIPVRFIRQDSEVDRTFAGIHLTNYESVREGKLDPNQFAVASLDEADVLRSYGSKTFQEFMPLFGEVEYKFVATATPSPNRFKELIHYAGFLGIMDTGQALTRFFQRNSEKAGDLTLYPHKEREFYFWLNSWAVFLTKPSDLGFSDEGYELPELDVIYHEVKVDHSTAGVDRDGQVQMFRSASLGVVDAAREKRDTLEARCAKVAEIVAADPADHFILWHDLEDERHELARLIPDVTEVYGSLDIEEREERIREFKNGTATRLATKPVLNGAGANFQKHCHRAVFAGIGHKFRDFIQAIHRIHRFLQMERCRIDIVYAESEQEVLRDLLRKWAQHKELQKQMSAIIREHGLNHLSMAEQLTRSIGVERIEAQGEGWLVANNDCVEECGAMAEDSVDLIVTSIPFSNHYEYTPSYNDFGHTDDNTHFWAQMDYLTPQLLRILKPGRIYCCHVKDRILFGNVTGAGVPTVSPFHAEALFHGLKHGFDYLGMVTVVTDVVRENNQTYRLGWTEQCKDGSKMGVGSPEYVLIFHKPQTNRAKGYADTPIVKSKDDYTRARWQVDAHALWRSSGNRLLTVEELASLQPEVISRLFTEYSLAEVYDYEAHIRIGEALELRGALPSEFMAIAPGSHHPDVWHDVNRMLTLNTSQAQKNAEKHVCPLQFDIVDRLIRRYSNPGEVVFDPFGGLFTVPYRALELGRRGRAVELNAGYYFDGIKYLQAMERKKSMPSLFDTLPDDKAAA